MSIKNIKVSAKLIGLVAIILIPFLLVVTYTAITLDGQKNDSIIINIAGRQRMLAQKYTAEFFDEQNAQLLEKAAKQNLSCCSCQTNRY